MGEKFVKVYDTKKLVEELTGKEWTTFTFSHDYAIIEGPKGVVVTCGEGVGFKADSPADTMSIGVQRPREGKRIPLMAEGSIELPISEVMEKAPVRRMTLRKYIRKFGARLERNYEEILWSLKEIGLDPANYPRKDKRAVVR